MKRMIVSEMDCLCGWALVVELCSSKPLHMRFHAARVVVRVLEQGLGEEQKGGEVGS